MGIYIYGGVQFGISMCLLLNFFYSISIHVQVHVHKAFPAFYNYEKKIVRNNHPLV